MIIFLFIFSMLFIGLVLVVIEVKTRFDVAAASFGFLVLGYTLLVLALLFGLAGHVAIDKKIIDSNYERESIVKQIECINSDYEDVSKSKVIENAYEWNNKVRNAKYWSENPFTNWFWSKKYVDSLKYINTDDIGVKR